MIENKNKIEVFWEIAEKLNIKLNSKPILYGSLGLSLLLEKEIKAEDIDILIEGEIFDKRLNKIHDIMTALKFVLVNPEENEFQRDGIKVGIASDEDLISFSGVNPEKLQIVEDTAKARFLSLHEYLLSYQASRKDGYRKDTKNKNDDEKIKLINEQLKKENKKSNKQGQIIFRKK